MRQFKIPHSFQFSKHTAIALKKLAKLPAYGTMTRVIEILVSEKANELGIKIGRNNNSGNDNGKNSESPTQ